MRARRLQFLGLIIDEYAVALTEFAIVIPVVLLFFFALLQYFSVAQASQLANYAAFVAARVYAVQASINPDEAKEKALTAAAMAMAPVARPVPGELGGPNAGSDFGSFLNPVLGSKAGKFLAGYAMAKYVRLNSSLLGGSVNAQVQGDPKQVDVTISYPQPIYVPGLMEMWNFVMGDRIYQSMKPLRQGLGGIPGKVLPVYETLDKVQSFQNALNQFDPGIANQLSSLGSSIPTVLLPYINVQAKCSIGYSDWGSKPELQPRLPAKGNESDASAASSDPKLANTASNLQRASQDQQTYKDALSDAKDRCEDLVTADQALQSAHLRDDPIINDPKASALAKANARADLQSFQDVRDAAARASADAQSKLAAAQQQVEQDTGQNLPGMNCSVQ
jgi:hypothetical protein